MKRPRFSLRWLLVAFTLVAVVLYVLFVHPTIAANRFVAAVNRGDFSQLESLGLLRNLQTYNKDYTFEKVTVRAKLKPRAWRDVYKFRRNVDVRVAFPKGESAGGANGCVDYVVVHINGATWGREP
jgi:hypothetical protein